jgi:peptidyl-prolyl cis-trans isomerase C
MRLNDRLVRVGVLLAGIACAAALAACTQQSGNERPPQAGDVAVAKVGDQTVWASDVKREAVAQELIGEGEPLDPSSDLFRRALDEVIDRKLLAMEAKKRGIDKTALAQRRLMAARERILGDILVENTVDAAIDENAVRALYNEQLRLSKTTEEIRARVIMLNSQPEAAAVLSLLSTGVAFSDLATERSIDASTRFSGGDLGYFTLDVMPEAYANALKGAKAGDTVGPFEVDGKWALLRVEDRRPEKPLTIEEARPQILRFLTYDEVRQLLLKLRSRAKVRILIKSDPSKVPGAPREPASAPPASAALPTDALRPPLGAPAAPPDLTPSQAPARQPAPAAKAAPATQTPPAKTGTQR